MKGNGDYRAHEAQREIHRQHQGRKDRRHGGDRRRPGQRAAAPWWSPNPVTTALMGIALLAWTDATLVAVTFLWVALLSLVTRLGILHGRDEH